MQNDRQRTSLTDALCPGQAHISTPLVASHKCVSLHSSTYPRCKAFHKQIPSNRCSTTPRLTDQLIRQTHIHHHTTTNSSATASPRHGALPIEHAHSDLCHRPPQTAEHSIFGGNSPSSWIPVGCRPDSLPGPLQCPRGPPTPSPVCPDCLRVCRSGYRHIHRSKVSDTSCQVEHSDLPNDVVDAGCEEKVAVGTQRHCTHLVVVIARGDRFLAADIPQNRRAIV